MSTAALPFRLPKPIGRKVRLLRWLVRLYVCLDGLAALVLVLGIAFWAGLAIDWVFEPSPLVRALLWAVTAAAAVYALGRYFVGPFFAKLSNANLALLLERNHPELKQSLITTIEAADRRRQTPIGNEDLLSNTSNKAITALREFKLRRIFQFGPLLWKAGIAAVLVLASIAFSQLQTETFGFWLQRLKLGEEPWPRLVELSVSGFTETDSQMFVNVARDDDFVLEVTASIRDGHEAPEQVDLRYRLDDGRRATFAMTRIGSAVAGRDQGQLFRYEFKKVSGNLQFDLIGGDARLRDLQLRIVERPQVLRLALDCEFPEYLDRASQTLKVSGRIELPEGTQAICRLESSKPLQSVRVYDPAQQADLLVELSSENNSLVSFPITIDSADRVLLITMLDEDGVENREPHRVVLSHIADQPPEVSVQLNGIGSAITPQAKIPFSGQVTDEYGLQAAWFEYLIDEQPPAQRLLAGQPNGRLKLRAEGQSVGQFDLALIDPATKRPVVELKPGQQLTLSVRASDAYNLQEHNHNQRHVGSSQRFLLDVVTDSELRALLEKKELTLRQRFESIHEKMIGTVELLDRIDGREKTSAEKAGVETDTDTVAGTDADTERQQQRDRLRVAGSIQNVVQFSYETLGVADGFEEIIGELTNNRVNSEELTERLQVGIAEPLREIGSVLMPQLEKQLQALQASASKPGSLQKPLAQAKAEGEVVLEAMQKVLNRMLELESYNELVDLLREIVAEQKEVQAETKQKRREKLRSLLED